VFFFFFFFDLKILDHPIHNDDIIKIVTKDYLRTQNQEQDIRTK